MPKTKKQGAGTSIEHYIQDAAEIRLTARLQEEAERLGEKGLRETYNQIRISNL